MRNGDFDVFLSLVCELGEMLRSRVVVKAGVTCISDIFVIIASV